MAWAGNRALWSERNLLLETIEIWKLERIDPFVTDNCIFFSPLFLPPLHLSLFLPQFRWIFIATVTIALVEKFLLRLIWTLTGNDSIVWHERSLIAIALPCHRRSDSPPLFFSSPDANEDGAGYESSDPSCRCSPPELSRLLSNFIENGTRATVSDPFVKIHLCTLKRGRYRIFISNFLIQIIRIGLERNCCLGICNPFSEI